MNDMKYAVFFANWQPVVPKYNWLNWQWPGFTNQNRDRHSGPERTFQRRITDCSIVFLIEKYVNLACFLNICKHIMVFLCFSRVKNLGYVHTWRLFWLEKVDERFFYKKQSWQRLLQIAAESVFCCHSNSCNSSLALCAAEMSRKSKKLALALACEVNGKENVDSQHTASLWCILR